LTLLGAVAASRIGDGGQGEMPTGVALGVATPSAVDCSGVPLGGEPEPQITSNWPSRALWRNDERPFSMSFAEVAWGFAGDIPATAETKAALERTLREIAACQRVGDRARALPFYGDFYLHATPRAVDDATSTG